MVKEGSVAWWRRKARTDPVDTPQQRRDYYSNMVAWLDIAGSRYPKRMRDRAEKIASFFYERMKSLGWDV
tara:strand:+ start:824 stop:1033 length:210 start_codon:yes stop_codon:yes gene_type:complete